MFVFPHKQAQAKAAQTAKPQAAQQVAQDQERRIAPLSANGFLFKNELKWMSPAFLLLLFRTVKKDKICYAALRTNFSAALLDSASPASILKILTKNFDDVNLWYSRNKRKIAYSWWDKFPTNMFLKTRNIANFVAKIETKISALKRKPFVPVTADNDRNVLIMTYGNITYGGWACNGGSRMILSYLNFEGDCRQFHDHITDHYSDCKLSAQPSDIYREYGVPPVGMGSIQYRNIDCTKEHQFQFYIDVGNTTAGVVTCLYLVPMLYRTVYPIDFHGTPPYYLDRTYILPQSLSNGTSMANIYNNYPNTGDYGQPFTFYNDPTKSNQPSNPNQRCLLNRMQQYDATWYYQNESSDPEYGCTYNFDPNKDPISGGGKDPVLVLGQEWGIGYNDAQGVGMGSSIEIDIVECTPCGLSITLHGLNNPEQFEELGIDWSEYDTDGYFVNIHNAKGPGLTTWGEYDITLKFETFNQVQNSSFVPGDSNFCPFAYGPNDVNIATIDAAMLETVTNELNSGIEATISPQSFFFNSLLPLKVSTTLTPMDEGFQILTYIVQYTTIPAKTNKATIKITCYSGGFPKTTTITPTTELNLPSNQIPAQDLYQQLDKMSTVVGVWSTSQKYDTTGSTKLIYDISKDNDFRRNTTWWLDGYCPMSDTTNANRGWCLPYDGFLIDNPNFVDNEIQINFRKYDLYKNLDPKYKYYSLAVQAQSYIQTQNTEAAKSMVPLACMITDLSITENMAALKVSCWCMDIMYRGLSCDEFNPPYTYNKPLLNWSGGYNSMYGVCTGTVSSEFVLRNAAILDAGTWSDYQLLTNDPSSVIRFSGGTNNNGDNNKLYKNQYNLAGQFNAGGDLQIQSAEVSFMGQKNIGMQWLSTEKDGYDIYGNPVKANKQGCVFNKLDWQPGLVVNNEISVTYNHGDGNGDGTKENNYELDYFQFDTISCLALNVLTHYNLYIG